MSECRSAVFTGFKLISWGPLCYRRRYRAMKIVDMSITSDELKAMASDRFGDLGKAVVDTATGVMAIDGELHADEEALLLYGGLISIRNFPA
jgi:hypothetical protein